MENNCNPNSPRLLMPGVSFTPPPPGFEGVFPAQARAAKVQAIAFGLFQEKGAVPKQKRAVPMPPPNLVGCSSVVTEPEAPEKAQKEATAPEPPAPTYELFSSKPQFVNYPFKNKVRCDGDGQPGSSAAAAAKGLKKPHGYSCAELLFPGVTVCNSEFQATIPGTKWFMRNMAYAVARKYRYFRFNVIVYSAMELPAIVKVFIAPKPAGVLDEHTVLRMHRRQFMECDCFHYRLLPGYNTIKRQSIDFRGKMESYQSNGDDQADVPHDDYTLYYYVAPYPASLLWGRKLTNFDNASGIYAHNYPLDKPIYKDWSYIVNNGHLENFSVALH